MTDAVSFLALLLVLFVCTLGACLTPLYLDLPRAKMVLVSNYSMGLLVGAALAVVIPEGVESLYSSGGDRDGLSYYVGLALLCGFLVIYLAEGAMHRGHAETPEAHDQPEPVFERYSADGFHSPSPEPAIQVPDIRASTDARIWAPSPAFRSAAALTPAYSAGTYTPASYTPGSHTPSHTPDWTPSQTPVPTPPGGGGGAAASSPPLRPGAPSSDTCLLEHDHGKFGVLCRYAAFDDTPAPPAPEHTHRGQLPQAIITGLVIHAVADGISLGAASAGANALSAIVFLAIVLHKLPTAFALASLLLAISKRDPSAFFRGTPATSRRVRRRLVQYLILFSAATPVGTLATSALLWSATALSPLLPGCALLFSGGTFLFVATSLISSHAGATQGLVALGMATPFVLSLVLPHDH